MLTSKCWPTVHFKTIIRYSMGSTAVSDGYRPTCLWPPPPRHLSMATYYTYGLDGRWPSIANKTSHVFTGGTTRRPYATYEQRQEVDRDGSAADGGRLLTTQEVATALRPFYFAVHPDRFWSHPNAKDTNEDSLKQLNAYLAVAVDRRERPDDRRLTFYIRQQQQPTGGSAAIQDTGDDVRLKQIYVNLLRRETVNRIVHKVLSECQLSTDYLNRLGKQPSTTTSDGQQHRRSTPYTKSSTNAPPFKKNSNLNDFWINWKKGMDGTAEEVEDDDGFDIFVDNMRRHSDQNMREWLRENRTLADQRQATAEPIRQEFHRLADELIRELELEDVVWKDCGWGFTHVRGALKSVLTLSQQFAPDFQSLRGRTLAFGRQTGVTFDGHVVLNIEDVRHNWLSLIRNIPSYNQHLRRLPAIEAELSTVLRGIRVVHRKFRPSVLVKSYAKHVSKLTAAIETHTAQHGYPANWPPTMDAYKLVVECEAGPLMLSPTGQFIVPASCPAGLLLDFMSTNLFRSRLLSDMYLVHKWREDTLIAECMASLGLESLEKDDNVTPDLMVGCCERLLAARDVLPLRGCRLKVSHYYSVLLDGEICIPCSFVV